MKDFNTQVPEKGNAGRFEAKGRRDRSWWHESWWWTDGRTNEGEKQRRGGEEKRRRGEASVPNREVGTGPLHQQQCWFSTLLVMICNTCWQCQNRRVKWSVKSSLSVCRWTGIKSRYSTNPAKSVWNDDSGVDKFYLQHEIFFQRRGCLVDWYFSRGSKDSFSECPDNWRSLDWRRVWRSLTHVGYTGTRTRSVFISHQMQGNTGTDIGIR